MGHPRPRPDNLSKKLLYIREWFGYSQTQMRTRLGLDKMHAGRISEYERNIREPATKVLLAYADLAGVHVEDLINDKVGLPDKLPGNVHHGVLPPQASKLPRKLKKTND